MVAHQRDPLDPLAGQRFQVLLTKLTVTPAHRRSVWDRAATQHLRDLIAAWSPEGETGALRQRRVARELTRRQWRVVRHLDSLLAALRPHRSRYPARPRRVQVVDRRLPTGTTGLRDYPRAA